MNMSALIVLAIVSLCTVALIVIGLRKDKGALIAVSPLLIICVTMIGHALYLLYGLQP